MCTCGTNSCGCNNSTVLPVGPSGDNGTNGTNGLNGLFGGYSSSWNFDNGLSNNPGLTDFRFNASNPTLVTEIYVNTTNSENITIAAFLASFANSANYGNLRVFDIINSAIFHYYKITNLSLTGTVYTISVTYISGSGNTPLVNNSINVLSFVEKGEVGNTGLDGNDGINGIDGTDGIDGTNGIDGVAYQVIPLVGINTRYLSLTSGVCVGEVIYFAYPGSSTHRSPTRVKLVAKSSVSVTDCSVVIEDVTHGANWINTSSIAVGTSVTIIDLGAPSNINSNESLIRVQVCAGTGGDLSAYSLMIDYL